MSRFVLEGNPQADPPTTDVPIEGLEGLLVLPSEVPPEDEDDPHRFVEIDPHTGREIPVLTQGESPNVMDRIRNYLGIRPPETTPLQIEAMEKGVRPFDIREQVFTGGKEEELRRIIGRGFAGITGGLSDLVKGYEERPETFPGALLGAGAELTGFLLGPFKAGKLITGTRLAPTAKGLQGVVQVMTQGAANLGTASMLSAAVPALMESDNLTQFTLDIIESGAIGGLIGALFPAMGAVPSKPLRVAVSLAVMDKIRAGPQQWFTIDDVFNGVKDGTIDSKQFADASFGYLMDIYFTLKVPSMKKQLAALDNMVTQRISGLSAQEAQDTIIGLGQRGDIGPEPTEGITRRDVKRSFGSEKNFDRVAKIAGAAEPTPDDPLAFERGIAKQVEQIARKHLPPELEIVDIFLVGSRASEGRKPLKPTSDVDFTIETRPRPGVKDPPDPLTFLARIQVEASEKIEPIIDILFGSPSRGLLPSKSMLREPPPPLGKLPPVLDPPSDATKVEAMFNRADAELNMLRSSNLKKLRSKIAAATLDVSAEVKKQLLEQGEGLGREAVIRHDLIRGMSAKADTIFSAAEKEIWRDLKKADEKLLDRIIQSRRTITVDKHRDQIIAQQRGLEARELAAGVAEAQEIAREGESKKAVTVESIDKAEDRAGEQARRLLASEQIKERERLALEARQEAMARGKEENRTPKQVAHAGLVAERKARRTIEREQAAEMKAAVTEARQEARDIAEHKALTSPKIEEAVQKAGEKARQRIAKEQEQERIQLLQHPEDLGGEEHTQYLEALRTSDPERHEMLNARADLYFDTMKRQLTDLHDNGLVTDELFNTLVSIGDYSPRRFIQHIDPDRVYTFGGRLISIPDSGIKRLDRGSTSSMENNARLLLTEVVARTQRRIGRNKANVALRELATAVPENDVVKMLGENEKAPPGFETISVMIEGEQERMAMPQDLARQWVETDPAVNESFANIIGWVSGTKILKPMATGLNPEFALANMPRDIIHVWLTTHEYSPHFPRFFGQIAADFKATSGDAIFRRGAYADYINEGGGMSFLTHQGRITGKTSGMFSNIQTVLGYLGETSEVWTRLALRNRALKNNAEPHEATWIARNYLDFSQGGWATKGADHAIPYLNASVQATRGVARAARESPAELTWKFAQLGTLASGLFIANRVINKDALDSVPAREKVNNYIFTTPLTFIDDEGNKRWLYFKVAKDQSQRIVSTVFEAMMAKMMGDEIDVDQVTQAAQDFFPLMPTDSLPPTMSAMMGYYSNKDFWRNEDIWKGPVVQAREEYTNYTHPALREIGQLTGLSPERTGQALTEFFTYGNIYTSAVGAGTAKLMEALGEETRERTTMDIVNNVPFLRRVMRSTEPFEPFRKEIEDVRLGDQTDRFIITRDLDKLSEKFYRAKKEGKEIKGLEQQVRQFIRKQPPDMIENLIRRHVFFGKIFEIPDRRFWLNIRSLSPEARAGVFWTRWMQSDARGKHELQQQAASIPGILSERFIIQFGKLRKASTDAKLIPEGEVRFVIEAE